MEKVCRKYQNAQVLSPLFIKTSLLSLPLSKSCKKVVLIVLNCVWFFTYARPAVFVSTELAAVKILMQFFNPGPGYNALVYSRGHGLFKLHP